MNVAKSILIPMLAICATVAALFAAALVGGPFARTLFGVPVGFREHFTSSAALRQALGVQIVMICIAFLLLGVALGRKVQGAGFGWTLLAANPITLAIGFVVYKIVYQALPLPHDLEYYGLRSGMILAVAGSIVFPFCSVIGTRLVKMAGKRGVHAG